MECVDIRDLEEPLKDMDIHVFDSFISEDTCNRLVWSFYHALPPFDVTMNEGEDYLKHKRRVYGDYGMYCPDSPAHLMFRWVRNKIRRKVNELHGPNHFHHLTLIAENPPSPHAVYYHADNVKRDDPGAYREFSGCDEHGHGVYPNKTGDAGELWLPHDGDWIPNHTPTRSYTNILYLNDDFGGGETHFPHLGVQCKPKVGTLLMFNSNGIHEHGVRPVEANSRLNISAWFASEERNEQFKDTPSFNQREAT